MKKILISDYDNTLYINDREMQDNMKSIKKFKEKGNLFVIATGRSFLDLEKKIKLFDIEFDYLILGHGTVILDKHKKIIKFYAIDNKIIESLLNEIEFLIGITRIILFDIFERNVNLENDNLTKLLLQVDSIELGEKILKIIDNKYKELKAYLIVEKDYFLVEVISKYTDKGEAIEDILKIENIDNENVFTIGDGSNDLEMIKKYNGYSMVNSDKCILEAAKKSYSRVSDLIEEII